MKKNYIDVDIKAFKRYLLNHIEDEQYVHVEDYYDESLEAMDYYINFVFDIEDLLDIMFNHANVSQYSVAYNHHMDVVMRNDMRFDNDRVVMYDHYADVNYVLPREPLERISEEVDNIASEIDDDIAFKSKHYKVRMLDRINRLARLAVELEQQIIVADADHHVVIVAYVDAYDKNGDIVHDVRIEHRVQQAFEQEEAELYAESIERLMNDHVDKRFRILADRLNIDLSFVYKVKSVSAYADQMESSLDLKSALDYVIREVV